MSHWQPSDADLYQAFVNPNESRATVAGLSLVKAMQMVAYRRKRKVPRAYQDLALSDDEIAQAILRHARGQGTTCPECGVANVAGSRFCNQCGAGIEAAPAQAPYELPPRDVQPARPSGKTWRTVLVVVGAVLAFCCLGLFIVVMLTPDMEQSAATRVAQQPAAPSLEAGEEQPTQHLVPSIAVETTAPSETPLPTDTPGPTDTPAPTNTPAPTDTPAPTNTPLPTATSTTPPTPVVLSGSGQTATVEIMLPSTISAAHFTHNGGGNFAVWAYVGADRDLLINTIGSYDGTRLLVTEQPVIFDITADGNWALAIQPVGWTDSATFAGRGDAVSGLFTPPATGAWVITHEGQGNFAVWLHCAGGTNLIQNEIGAVNASTMIPFPDGPCLWEVVADGAWSLFPR